MILTNKRKIITNVTLFLHKNIKEMNIYNFI